MKDNSLIYIDLWRNMGHVTEGVCNVTQACWEVVIWVGK